MTEVLYGDQTPRILWSPPAPTSAGEEAIDLAAEFGLMLDPWQQLVLIEALKERDDGKWAAFEVGLMVSRQQGKGSVLAALEIAGLLLFGEELILHTAHELKTSKEAMRRLEGLLQRGGVKFKTTHSHGEERIELIGGPNSGARVMFQTRTKVAGLGLSIDRVIFDEAMIISPEAMGTLIPTLSARPNAQLWYTGSAVDQRTHVNCEAFAGLRNRAFQKNDPRLCYLEWSCEDDVDPTDMRERQRANPGLGYRLSLETIDDEYRSFNGVGNLRGFGVMRLGIGDWPLLGDARSEIPVDKWKTLTESEPDLSGPSILTLYRAPEGGPWAIAGAQRTADGRIHTEIGYVGLDTADEVIQKLTHVVTAWGPVVVLVGRGAAADEVPGLEAVGIETITPTLSEEAQACGGFLNDVFADTKLLSHSGQTSLNTAVKHAIKHPLPAGGFVWTSNDMSAYVQLMGVSLAHWGVLKYGTESAGPQIHGWPDDEEIELWMKKMDDQMNEMFEKSPLM